MANYHRIVDLPRLKYTKDVYVDDNSATTTYCGISLSHFKTIVSISKSLADAGIGPKVINVDNNSFTITVERVYPVKHIGKCKEGVQCIVDTLKRIHICHGDLLPNVMKTANNKLVLIDLDQSFYYNSANKTRLKAYASMYAFEDEEDLEAEFIDNDATTVEFMDSDSD